MAFKPFIEIKNKIVKLLPGQLQTRLPKEVVIVDVGEKTAQRLNRKYRKKDAPANVLSFRYGSEYGEILVCPLVVRREAKAAGNSFDNQMTWMVVHGMLHLAGMHHEQSPKIAQRVVEIEQRILSQINARERSVKR